MTDYFKIATWNVNSIRIRSERLASWIHINSPDIILLQETKSMNENFPREIFEEFGYNIYIKGQKSYNGVAIFSKIPADEIKYNFDNNPLEDEARFIEISLLTPIGYCKISSVYVPNGGEVGSQKFQNKLIFLSNLRKYLNSNRSFDYHYIVGGDFNVAPENIDVYSADDLSDTTCFTLDERIKLREILNSGFVDHHRVIHQSSHDFSWWDYRAGAFFKDEGMRIDYILSNYGLLSKLSDSKIFKEERAMEKASDHAPVMSIFKI